MKFLHVSDVHLGCTRYHLEESERDFFDAWIDVLKKYAIDEKVDFVVMGGDFFDKRHVKPETMNYAFAGLNLLKQHNIPVVSIEGNHDQRYADSRFSWLRSLANWNLLYLLEPIAVDGKLVYKPWNEELSKGGYIDIGRARIFGSHWYGSEANKAIPKLLTAIEESTRKDAFQILLLHTDIDGYQTHKIPAISVENLTKLKSRINYLGLGHTHKCYEIDNWAFNPGSLEVPNISEFKETRGAWLVNVEESGKVSAELKTDYVHRPFERISFDVDIYDNPKKLTDAVLEKVGKGRDENGYSTGKSPIIEVTLNGHLGFPNSDLELNKIRRKSAEITSAASILLKNHTIPIEYGEETNLKEQDREAIERNVIEVFVAQDKRFKKNLKTVSDAIIETKRMVLNEEPPEKIADFIAASIVNPPSA